MELQVLKKKKKETKLKSEGGKKVISIKVEINKTEISNLKIK